MTVFLIDDDVIYLCGIITLLVLSCVFL